MEEEKIDPQHVAARNKIRKAGIVLLVIGLVFTALGISSFFLVILTNSPFGFILFLFVFIGTPLSFIGLILTLYGYAGRIARYTAAESAPVTKDVINYTADGTKEGVKTIASAIGEGLGIKGLAEQTKIKCHKCGNLNNGDSKFCSNCGTALGKTKACPKCNELNDPDAKFCDNCGRNF